MILNKAVAIGLAGALSLAAIAPSSAMPVNAAAVKQAAPDVVTDVRWRGRGVAAGLGFGLLGGALIAGAYGPRYYGYYGYPRYAYYPGPYYGGPYWGPRRYYGWRYRHHRHWRHW